MNSSVKDCDCSVMTQLRSDPFPRAGREKGTRSAPFREGLPTMYGIVITG